MTQVTIQKFEDTTIGLKRRDNQDSYLSESGLYLVADGMGGGVGGQLASSTAISCFHRLRNAPIRSRAMIESCIREAQQRVEAIGEEKGAIAGTTLTGLILKDMDLNNQEDNSWYVINIGDSRTYHLSSLTNGSGWDMTTFSQLTHDHSQRQQAIDSGKMLPNEAKRLIPRNIITQAIGSPDGVQPDFFKADLEGRFIMCSDGIYGMIDETQMALLCSQNVTPETVVRNLIDAALDAGGDDNATVIVVDIKEDKNAIDPFAAFPEEIESTEEIHVPREWQASRLSPEEDIDSMNDYTLENLRVQAALSTPNNQTDDADTVEIEE